MDTVEEVTWDQYHHENQGAKYPKEELVRWATKTFHKPKGKSILDLGCGQGASSWFLAREGFDVVAVDSSQAALEKTRKRLRAEGLKATFAAMDADNAGFLRFKFDAVIDVACIQHNPPEKIPAILAAVYKALKPGGKFFSVMVSDTSAREPFSKWQTHFFSRAEVLCLVGKRFNNVTPLLSTYWLGPDHRVENWIVTADRK